MILRISNPKIHTRMTKTISFNDLRRIKDALPDGATARIADKLNTTPQTVRNIYDMAVEILQEEEKKKEK